MKIIKTYFYILVVAITFTSCPGEGNKVVGESFGGLLDGLFNRASLLIQQAQNSGLILEVNAGSQAQNLILSAKEAYNDALNHSASALDAEQQKFLSDIDGMLNQIKSGILDDFTKRSAAIVNTIPFSKTFPQLISYQGLIVPPNATDSIRVTINGNFFDIGNKDYDAVLKIDGHEYRNSTKTNQEIGFIISKNYFRAQKDRMIYKTFTLQIPYKKTKFLVLSSKEDAVFKYNFVVLPDTFGTYSLETTKVVDTIISENAICPNLNWNTHSGNDDDGIKGCSMENGWICNVSSVRVVFKGEEGSKGTDWFDRGSASNPTFVGWHHLATTKHGPFGNYGGVSIDLSYERYKPATINRTEVTQNQVLQWGESKVLNIDPTSSWKLVFNQFDGKHFEIASSSQKNSYINVRSLGNKIELNTAPFDF